MVGTGGRRRRKNALGREKPHQLPARVRRGRARTRHQAQLRRIANDIYCAYFEEDVKERGDRVCRRRGNGIAKVVLRNGLHGASHWRAPRLGPEVGRMQARQKNREVTACDKCYREMHGSGRMRAKQEQGGASNVRAVEPTVRRSIATTGEHTQHALVDSHSRIVMLATTRRLVGKHAVP